MIANTSLYHTLVAEFHTTFECPHFKTTEDAPCEIHKLRSRLITEEYTELISAWHRIDILDAICDLIYVVAGTAVTYSISVDAYTSCSIVLARPNLSGIHTRINYLRQELDSLFPCPKNTRKGINDLLAFLDDTARNYGFKMPEAFIRVHNNNMEKLWNEPAPQAYVSRRKGNKWLVKDKGGKVIKPPYHTKVDLSSCI